MVKCIFYSPFDVENSRNGSSCVLLKYLDDEGNQCRIRFDEDESVIDVSDECLVDPADYAANVDA